MGKLQADETKRVLRIHTGFRPNKIVAAMTGDKSAAKTRPPTRGQDCIRRDDVHLRKLRLPAPLIGPKAVEDALK